MKTIKTTTTINSAGGIYLQSTIRTALGLKHGDKVNLEVIDGALYGNPKQEFTVSEMKKLVNTFMKRKVK